LQSTDSFAMQSSNVKAVNQGFDRAMMFLPSWKSSSRG
jgi:hypothetical protein